MKLSIYKGAGASAGKAPVVRVAIEKDKMSVNLCKKGDLGYLIDKDGLHTVEAAIMFVALA